MVSFVAVLIDPSDRSPHALPLLVDSVPQALQCVRREHPDLVLHTLIDKPTLELWQQQLDELGQGERPHTGFIALMRDQRQAPLSRPVLAASMHAATDFLHAHFPHTPLDSLFERALIDRWVVMGDALEMAHTEAA